MTFLKVNEALCKDLVMNQFGQNKCSKIPFPNCWLVKSKNITPDINTDFTALEDNKTDEYLRINYS